MTVLIVGVKTLSGYCNDWERGRGGGVVWGVMFFSSDWVERKGNWLVVENCRKEGAGSVLHGVTLCSVANYF